MIKEAPIVKDTRRIRSIISKKFGDDFVRYIDYLIEQQSKSNFDKRSSSGITKEPIH